MMNKMAILNHKMNLLYDEVHNYINELNSIDTDNDIVVCPSSLYLESFSNYCEWGVGCQNFYYEEEGNYTGEISTNQLKSMGIDYAMIGHYERKKYFNDTLEDDKKKLEALIDANIMPILCIGEEKKGDKIDNVIKKLDKVIKNISHIEFITFAYEPSFSINGDDMYDIEELTLRIKTIYDYLEKKYKTKPRIVYGGGVTSNNIKKILQIEELCGIILGTSSISISFVKDIVSNM